MTDAAEDLNDALNAAEETDGAPEAILLKAGLLAAAEGALGAVAIVLCEEGVHVMSSDGLTHEQIAQLTFQVSKCHMAQAVAEDEKKIITPEEIH